MNWRTAELGKVVTQAARAEAPIPGTTYRQIGVKLWGEGAYERESIDGARTKYSQLFRAEGGDIIVNKIWARNGSVAVVPPSLAGCYGSGEFPMFTPSCDKLSPRWMHWLTKTKEFWAQCDEKSRGTSGKNRIRPEQFLRVEIPLPPLIEQQQIVARIEELASNVEEARGLRQQAMEGARTFYQHITADLFPEPAGSVVGDFIRFQTGYAFQSEWFSDMGIRLARNVNIGHGMIDWSETARIPEERRMEFLRFELELGDILVSLDRPIISTGVKVARVEEQDLPCLLLQRVARARFQNDNVLPDYLYQWLQSSHFVNAIDPGRSNGVPHISHKDIERILFTPPSLTEQHRIVTMLGELQSEVGGLRRAQTETLVELDALMPSILDKAFRGEL